MRIKKSFELFIIELKHFEKLLKALFSLNKNCEK